MSLYLLFAAAPLVLRTRRELNALSATLAVVILVAGLGFLALPAELAYDADREWGVWAGWFAVADQMNLHYNLAPSLHVALSVVCVDVFARRASGWTKGLLWLWAAAIALSTLLTHEHHLLDAVTGWLLALAGTNWLYRRLVDQSFNGGTSSCRQRRSGAMG
jgi:membrane-associated phospholipid phosphatase